VYGGHNGATFFGPALSKTLRLAPFAVLTEFEPPSACSGPAHDTHAVGRLTHGSKGPCAVHGHVHGLFYSPSAGSRGAHVRHGPLWPFFGALLLSLRARAARAWALQQSSARGWTALCVVDATAAQFCAALMPRALLVAETTFACFWCAGLVAANLAERHNQTFVSCFTFCTAPLAFPQQLLISSHVCQRDVLARSSMGATFQCASRTRADPLENSPTHYVDEALHKRSQSDAACMVPPPCSDTSVRLVSVFIVF
jgi:hypothetical protein